MHAESAGRLELRDRLDRFFTPRIVMLVGWIAFALYAYPGYMTADSVTQLNQARGVERVTDWHPPMMSFIWHYLDNLIAGPFLMLVLQSVSFLLGCYWILVRFFVPRRAAIGAVVLLLLPNNIVIMSVVWKDAMMAGFLVAGLASFLQDKLRWRLLGCLFIFLATAVRYNALAATLPLVVLLWDRDLVKRWYVRYAAGVGVWILVTGAALVADAALVQDGAQPFEIGAAPVDIAGILHYAPDIDIDQLVRENPEVPWKSGVDIRWVVDHKYKPVNSFNYLYQGESAIFEKPDFATQADALGALWKKLVREHPGAFFKHRVAVSKIQLNCAIPVWHAITMNADWAETVTGNRGTRSPFQRLWAAALVRILRLHMFRPRVYLIVSLLLVPLARRQRFALALLLSGIANELLLFAIAPSIAYRYSHWMVFAAILATIVLVTERMRASEASSQLRPG